MSATDHLLSPLKTIQTLLDQNDFETFFHEKSENQPFESLEVILESLEEGNDNEYKLSLHYVNEIAQAFGAVDEAEDIQLLEFFTEFPGAIQSGAFNEVARLILNLNRMLPVGNFGINEVNQSVYFQYNLGLDTVSITEVLLLEVLGMIHFFIHDLVPNILLVAEGKLTCEAYLKSFEEMGLSFSSDHKTD